jgi:hypothetical protein
MYRHKMQELLRRRESSIKASVYGERRMIQITFHRI